MKLIRQLLCLIYVWTDCAILLSLIKSPIPAVELIAFCHNFERFFHHSFSISSAMNKPIKNVKAKSKNQEDDEGGQAKKSNNGNSSSSSTTTLFHFILHNKFRNVFCSKHFYRQQKLLFPITPSKSSLYLLIVFAVIIMDL